MAVRGNETHFNVPIQMKRSNAFQLFILQHVAKRHAAGLLCINYIEFYGWLMDCNLIIIANAKKKLINS
jgi:hypothetical protein